MVIKTLPYRFKFPGNRTHVQWLFWKVSGGIVLLFILLSGDNYVCAQVCVTGHVYAEVVEPTALSLKTFNSHLIEFNSTSSHNELVLAQVNLSGGQNLNVDVVVKSSRLVAANGEIVPFDSIICPIFSEDDSDSFNGEKVFTLKAIPGESIQTKRNNTYCGGYSLVLMFN